MAGSQKAAIVIHGGAGTILRERLSAQVEADYRARLEESVKAGHAVLAADGSSLDAVVAAITVMEDSPLFNAGHGSVLTHNGTVEMDAAMMEGRDLNAGAVAGVKHVKNPITLAHRVLQHSPHVMLMGEGAELFARDEGFAFVDNAWFATDRRRRQLERLLREDAGGTALSEADLPEDDDDLDAALKDKSRSTVGAVAIDCRGDIAAGTSTGGMTNKRFGRIGDSPIIGAGTYADNMTGGISATGHGEVFIRAVAAHDICARAAYKGITLQQAADEVVLEKLQTMGGDGGVVGIDSQGNVIVSFNSSGMYHAWIDVRGQMVIGIFK